MEKSQVHQDIRLIKEMIEKTKKSTAESGTIFIVWTVMPILAILGMYLLIFSENYRYIWLNWLVFIGLGFAFTIYYYSKKENQTSIKTYIQIAVSYIWIACGCAFILLGFIFPLMGLYSYHLIPIMMAIIAGIGVFTTGGIIEWDFLKWCGVAWWLGSLVMAFSPGNFRILIFIPFLIIGYLIPGLVLNHHYRKKG